tara:strand:- start:5744 stop:6343 length:600 start_codon:yes stop_codon:yes gene_type:complete
VKTDFNQQSLQSFQNWFSGSVTVDDCGRPLILYHGTIHHFEPQDFRPMSHFGSARAATDITWQFNGKLYKNRRDVELPRGHIMPVFVRIAKPLDMIDTGAHKPHNICIGLKKCADENGWTAGETDTLKTYGDIISFLKERGFDGIRYLNTAEDIDSYSYIIFDKEQVRPAMPLIGRGLECSSYLAREITRPHVTRPVLR